MGSGNQHIRLDTKSSGISSPSESEKLRLIWGGPTGVTQDDVRHSLLRAGYRPIHQSDESDRTYQEYSL
jgi:hypothetical protein